MPRRYVALVAVLTFIAPSVAFAATFVVDSRYDSIDANPGDGVCADAWGACTLRAAILEANATAAPDLIELPRGHYRLTRSEPPNSSNPYEEDAGLTGDLDILHDLKIVGELGVFQTIVDADGQPQRVVDVHPGAVAELRQLTVTGGTSSVEGPFGAGIRNQGDLSLIDCRVVANDAGSNTGDAGGILNGGVLSVRRCEIARNFADDCGGLQNSGTAIVENSTFHSNSGESGNAICSSSGAFVLRSSAVYANRGFGSAISAQRGASLLIENSTISENESFLSCAGISGGPGCAFR